MNDHDFSHDLDLHNLPYTTERQTSWCGDKPYAARHSRHPPRSMIERGIIENSLCAALRRLTQ